MISAVDSEVRRIVDEAWCSRFGLAAADLHGGGVFVVGGDVGASEAFSFRLKGTCILLVHPDATESVRARIRDLDVDTVFSVDFLRGLVGPGMEIHGPSWHGYVSERSFRGNPDPRVVRLDRDDERLFSFLHGHDLAERAESGFPIEPSSADFDTCRFYGLFEHGALAAAGSLTEWRGHPCDVGLLTRSDARGRGLATRVASTMIAAALPRAGVVRYRALLSNRPSRSVASRIGFEGYGQNYRARRPTA